MSFNSSRQRKKHPYRQRPCRLWLEPLEDRTLLNGGGLDPTFGTGGLVTTDFSSTQTQVGGVILQPADDKLVVGGAVRLNPTSPKSIWALARYLPNGQLDTDPVTGFGPLDPNTMTRPGKITFDPTPGFSGSDFIGGLAVTPSGQIIVAGGIPSLFGRVAALARFNSDGSLDTSFGPISSFGIVTDSILLLTNATAINLVPDPNLVAGYEIIIAGNAFDFTSPARTLGFVGRFYADGFQDPSFGGSGTGNTTITFGGTGTQPNLLGIDADASGRILVAGGLVVSSTLQFRMIRLNADGTADPSFGIVTSPISSFFASAVKVQPDQSILVAGSATTATLTTFEVEKFTPSGSVDVTFGQNGGQDVAFNGGSAVAAGVVTQPDGLIILAGSVQVSPSGNSEGHIDFALARLHADGTPDLGFGANGQVTTNFGIIQGLTPSFDRPSSVLIQPDGNIVLAGTSNLLGDGRFALARYLSGAISTPVPVVATGGFTLTGDERSDSGLQILATFTDPNGPTPITDYSATIDWGDNSSSLGTIFFDPNHLIFAVEASHTYSEEGNYPINVVIHRLNSPDTSAQSAANVIDLPVVPVQINPTLTMFEGTLLDRIFLTSFIDPAGPENLSDYSATIDWGDRTTSEGAVYFDPGSGVFTVLGDHSYQEEGNYIASLTLHHDSRETGVDGIQVTVIDLPVVPVHITPSLSLVEGTSGPITLATFSDPGGAEDVSDYSADIFWGDGTQSSGTIQFDSTTGVFSVLTETTYREEGDYTISLILHHDDRETGIGGIQVTVVDPAVIPLQSPPRLNLIEGTSTGLMNLLTFQDPAGPEDFSDYSATVDWGDHTTSGGTIFFDPNNKIWAVFTDHTYQEEGNYSITITLNHDGRISTAGGIQASVVDPAVIPLQIAPTLTMVEGTPTGGAVLGTFTDPGGPESLADYSATIDWGDQTTSSGTIQFDSSTGIFTVLGDHAYQEEGVYSVSMILDHEGRLSGISGITANVTDAPLTLSPIRINAIAGGPFSGIVASFTDADAQGMVSDYRATIRWGDGTMSAGVIAANASGGFNVSGIHTYASTGHYVFLTQVFDLGGSEVDQSSSATVSDLGQSVQRGLAGGIGFWHNGNGQALINSFNGGSTATALSNWLATTFPNLYGAGAGFNNITGFINAQVAAFYQSLFAVHGPRLDAEVLGVALDVYATTQSLGGNAAVTYGFHVTSYGLGAYSYNIGASGLAFGVPNIRVLNVYQILQSTDLQAANGFLFNGNRTLEMLALVVFDGIATAGSI